MEYRRRYNSRRRRETSGMGALRALVLVLMFGAAAYLLLGTGLGRKLKDGYAASLLTGCAGKSTEAPGYALPTGSPLPFHTEPGRSDPPMPSAAGITAEVSLPGIGIHMLQLGVFDSEDALEGAAAEVKTRGGAGYVYNDGGSPRLILAAYTTEAQAESVKQNLASEGLECSVFTVSRDGAQLLVTADEARLVPIRTAFSAAFDAVAQIDELSADLDSNSRSSEYVKGVLAEIDANCLTAVSGIEGELSRNATLGLLAEYYSDLRGFIASAAEVPDGALLSSALKELRIKASLRYALLLDETCGRHA